MYSLRRAQLVTPPHHRLRLTWPNCPDDALTSAPAVASNERLGNAQLGPGGQGGHAAACSPAWRWGLRRQTLTGNDECVPSDSFVSVTRVCSRKLQCQAQGKLLDFSRCKRALGPGPQGCASSASRARVRFLQSALETTEHALCLLALGQFARRGALLTGVQYLIPWRLRCCAARPRGLRDRSERPLARPRPTWRRACRGSSARPARRSPSSARSSWRRQGAPRAALAAINAQNASTCAPLAAWRSANLSTHDGVIDQGRWIHCSNQGRTGNCRYNALQMLCDLAVCEAMIRRHERSAGRFDTIPRLRPDVWWRWRSRCRRRARGARLHAEQRNGGAPTRSRSASARDGSLPPAGRPRRVKAAYRQGEFKQLTTEQFLQHVLHRESRPPSAFRVACVHTTTGRSWRAQRRERCVPRARWRALRSFVYSKHENVKPWALCFNASCAELRQRGVSHVDSNGRSHASIHRLCADSDGRQPRRACPIVSANNTARAQRRRCGTRGRRRCGPACCSRRLRPGGFGVHRARRPAALAGTCREARRARSSAADSG